MTPTDRQDTRPRLQQAVRIGLVATAIRIGFVIGFGLHDIRYDSLYDDQLYTNLAHQVLRGHGFVPSVDYFVASAGKPTSIVVPGYPLLLAASFSVFGPSYLPIKLLQAVLGGLTAAALYVLTSRIVGRREGVLAGWIAAGYLPFIMYVRPLLTETIASFLLIATVLVVYVLVKQPSKWGAVGCGLILGLAAITRTEMVTYGAALVAFAAYRVYRVSGAGRAAQYCGLMALGVVLFLIPWSARNWQVHQRVVISENKFWHGWSNNWLRYQQENTDEWRRLEFPERRVLPNWEHLSEVERDHALLQMNATFIRQHPIVFARYALSRLVQSFPVVPREFLPAPWGTRDVPYTRTDGLGRTALDEFPQYKTVVEQLRVWSFRAIFLLAAAGIIVALRRHQLNTIAPLLAFIAINVTVAALWGGRERYRLTIDPYLILFATIALSSIAGWRFAPFAGPAASTGTWSSNSGRRPPTAQRLTAKIGMSLEYATIRPTSLRLISQLPGGTPVRALTNDVIR